jgi:hypothetical protein
MDSKNKFDKFFIFLLYINQFIQYLFLFEIYFHPYPRSVSRYFSFEHRDFTYILKHHYV